MTQSTTQIGALVLAILSIFAVSALLQFHVHLNHDVAWVVHSTGWLLDGKAYGVDIVEPNPPLIWYLSLPAAFASRLLSIAEPTSFRCYFYGVSALLLVLTWRALRPLRKAGHTPLAAAMLLTLAYCTLIAAGRYFGQREVLTTMLVFPYLLVVAGRSSGDRPSIWLSTLSGTLAGLGFAMKPYFLLSPALVEAWYALKQGTVRSLFRVESVALASCVGLYGAAVFLITPEYAFSVVPLVQSIYWAFEVESLRVLSGLLPSILLFSFVLAFLPFSCVAVRPYFATVILAVGGFAAAYLIQWKGYVYQVFPVSALLTVLVLLVIGSAIRNADTLGASRRAVFTAFRFGLMVLLVLVFIFQFREVAMWYRVANMSDGAFGVQTERLIDVANRHAAGSTIYAFSTHPYPGCTVACHSRARWGSRMNSQFVIPAVVKRSVRASVRDDRALDEAIAFQRRVVVEDFLKNEPAVVFVDNSKTRHAIGTADFDFLAFFNSDPEFAAIWKRYKEVEPINAIRVFVRDDSPRAKQQLKP